MEKKFQITDYDIVFSGLKEGEHNYIFKISDTLLFGKESAGVPSKVHKILKHKIFKSFLI